MTSSDDHRPGHQQHEFGPREPVEQRARELWQEAARRIDPATAGRLREARRQALQSAHAPARQAARWLIPTGAVAAVALAAMVVWQPLPHAPAPLQDNHAVGALEADNELPPGAEQADPALYQNLDFYAWLAANDPQPETR